MKMNERTDKELFDALRNGDEAALSILFMRHYDYLKHYGLRIGGHHTLVEGCIQEMFLHLFKSFHRFGEVFLVRAYLFKALRRRVIDAIHKEKRYKDQVGHLLGKVDVQFYDEDLVVNEELQDRTREILLRSLDQLPWRQREAIYLRYYNGLSTREIAKIMGAANQTILNTLYQALKKLRALGDLRNLKNEV